MNDWTQTITIIVTIICGGYYLHRDILQDIKSQTERIDAQALRTDKLYEMFIEQRDKQSERSDKLYEMFIDLLKEKR